MDCDPKKMFGYPAQFINENIFSGTFVNSIFIRSKINYNAGKVETLKLAVLNL
jgi:hypothetical protein